MKLSDLHPERDIILVSGRLCSGKGHYCTTNYPDHFHLPVSSVVKQLANTQVRSELAKTADMDQLIIQELMHQIKAHPKIVIDGIRQPSIIRAIQDRFGDRVRDVIWLDVPENVRKQRFAARADQKDDASFDIASQGDENLGISDVEQHIRTSGRVVPNH